MKLCTKCGAFLDDTVTVCSTCGTPVAEPPAPAPAPAPVESAETPVVDLADVINTAVEQQKAEELNAAPGLEIPNDFATAADYATPIDFENEPEFEEPTDYATPINFDAPVDFATPVDYATPIDFDAPAQPETNPADPFGYEAPAPTANIDVPPELSADAFGFEATPAEPTYEAPTFDAITPEIPTYEAPSFDMPTYEAPSFDTPTGNSFETPTQPDFTATEPVAAPVDFETSIYSGAAVPAVGTENFESTIYPNAAQTPAVEEPQPMPGFDSPLPAPEPAVAPIPDFLQPTAPVQNMNEPVTPTTAPVTASKKAPAGKKKFPLWLLILLIVVVLVVIGAVSLFLFGSDLLSSGTLNAPETTQTTVNSVIPQTEASTQAQTEPSTQLSTEPSTEVVASIPDSEKAKLVFDAAASVFNDAQTAEPITGTNNQGFTADDGSQLGVRTKDALVGEFDYAQIVIIANESGVQGAFYNGYLYDSAAGDTFDYSGNTVADILAMLG